MQYNQWRLSNKKHTQHSKFLNHLRAAKSEIVQIICARQKNKQKKPKKQRRKRKKKTKETHFSVHHTHWNKTYGGTVTLSLLY